MKVAFQRERAHELWDEAFPLFRQHSAEQEHDQTIPLDPDIERYNLAEEVGLLRCFTARMDGVLIGYGVFGVCMSLRHRTLLEATQDSLYLIPNFRKGRIGIQFIRFMEAELKAEGVIVIRQHTHPDTPLDGLLPKMGYSLVHREWEKRL